MERGNGVNGPPMCPLTDLAAFDALPPPLRAYVRNHPLPLSGKAFFTRFHGEYAGCVSPILAFARRIDPAFIANAVHDVWGADHPQAKPEAWRKR